MSDTRYVLRFKHSPNTMSVNVDFVEMGFDDLDPPSHVDIWQATKFYTPGAALKYANRFKDTIEFDAIPVHIKIGI